jgi:hypothetical protein
MAYSYTYSLSLKMSTFSDFCTSSIRQSSSWMADSCFSFIGGQGRKQFMANIVTDWQIRCRLKIDNYSPPPPRPFMKGNLVICEHPFRFYTYHTKNVFTLEFILVVLENNKTNLYCSLKLYCKYCRYKQYTECLILFRRTQWVVVSRRKSLCTVDTKCTFFPRSTVLFYYLLQSLVLDLQP